MKAASYANALLDNMFRNSVADALGLALIESDSEQYLLNSLRHSRLKEEGKKLLSLPFLVHRATLKSRSMYTSWGSFVGEGSTSKHKRSYVNIHQQDYNFALFIFNGKN